MSIISNEFFVGIYSWNVMVQVIIRHNRKTVSAIVSFIAENIEVLTFLCYNMLAWQVFEIHGVIQIKMEDGYEKDIDHRGYAE